MTTKKRTKTKKHSKLIKSNVTKSKDDGHETQQISDQNGEKNLPKSDQPKSATIFERELRRAEKMGLDLEKYKTHQAEKMGFVSGKQYNSHRAFNYLKLIIPVLHQSNPLSFEEISRKITKRTGLKIDSNEIEERVIDSQGVLPLFKMSEGKVQLNTESPYSAPYIQALLRPTKTDMSQLTTADMLIDKSIPSSKIDSKRTQISEQE